MSKDIYKKINRLKKELDKSVKKTGINSDETREISNKVDKLIKEYYVSIRETEFPSYSDMYLYYKHAYKALKNVTQQLKKFPTIQEWDNFAKENNYLSHTSLEYISKHNWNNLRIKVLRELNMEI